MFGLTNISIHALLAESDALNLLNPRPARLFLSTLSLRRATQKRGNRETNLHFYPRSPCGERRKNAAIGKPTCYFYPRSPCGERLDKIPNQCQIDQFLSTLSLRRATSKFAKTSRTEKISIHALLAESDPVKKEITILTIAFLSTLSLRRATLTDRKRRAFVLYFYPRSPCGERHNINSSVNTADKISIHALLAESDPAKHTEP